MILADFDKNLENQFRLDGSTRNFMIRSTVMVKNCIDIIFEGLGDIKISVFWLFSILYINPLEVRLHTAFESTRLPLQILPPQFPMVFICRCRLQRPATDALTLALVSTPSELQRLPKRAL